MSGRFSKLLVAVGLTVATAGCQQKSRIREDPFLPSTGSRASPSAASDARDDYRSKDNRDLAKGVSTSPATDDDYGRPRGKADRDDIYAASGRNMDSGSGRSAARDRSDDRYNDPLVNSDRPPPEKSQAVGNRVSPREASYARTESAKNRDDSPKGSADRDAVNADQAVQFEQIRRRLDKIGARNICLETVDRGSGEMSFRCEVPFPGATDRVRVFEARDSSEIKLMLAVAEAAEKWVDSQKS